MRIFVYFSVLALASFNSSAFSVDKMILVSDEYNNGILTVMSTSSKPEYIGGFINKIEIIDGEINKVKLDKNNLPLWDMALIPNRIILNPGERRRIALKNLCQSNCNVGKDKMYQIVLMPVTEEGKEINSVGINLGYAPVFIIPADKVKTEYKLSLANGILSAENNGNSLIYLNVDSCSDDFKKNCSLNYTLLSGRKKNYSIPTEMIKNGLLKVKVANYDYSYNETEYIDEN